MFLRLAYSWICWQPCFPEFAAVHVPTTRLFLRKQPAMFLRFTFSWICYKPCSLYSNDALFLNVLPTIFLPLACSWGTSQPCSYDSPVPKYPADHVPTTRLFLRNQPAMFLLLNMLATMTDLFLNILLWLRYFSMKSSRSSLALIFHSPTVLFVWSNEIKVQTCSLRRNRSKHRKQ